MTAKTWTHYCPELTPPTDWLLSVPEGEACSVCGDVQAPPAPVGADTTSALDTQVAGSHYKDMAIQPVEFIHANGIGYFEGCAIKYLSRWRVKNGVEDLRKARHFIDLLIELETKK